MWLSSLLLLPYGSVRAFDNILKCFPLHFLIVAKWPLSQHLAPPIGCKQIFIVAFTPPGEGRKREVIRMEDTGNVGKGGWWRVLLCEGIGPWERTGPRGCRGTYSLLCEITLPVCNVKECKEGLLTSKGAMAAREMEMRHENVCVRTRWAVRIGGFGNAVAMCLH